MALLCLPAIPPARSPCWLHLQSTSCPVLFLWPQPGILSSGQKSCFLNNISNSRYCLNCKCGYSLCSQVPHPTHRFIPGEMPPLWSIRTLHDLEHPLLLPPSSPPSPSPFSQHEILQAYYLKFLCTNSPVLCSLEILVCPQSLMSAGVCVVHSQAQAKPLLAYLQLRNQTY